MAQAFTFRAFGAGTQSFRTVIGADQNSNVLTNPGWLLPFSVGIRVNPRPTFFVAPLLSTFASPFRDLGDFAFNQKSRTHHVRALRVSPSTGSGLFATNTEQKFPWLDYAAPPVVDDRHLPRR